ncbi:MAG: CBS domain-containing protein [Actinomycetota bacterium]|nr:CBS domain-containing protein [Actinomycetota bacterium]
MPRNTPVRQVMTSDVVVLRPEDKIEEAARTLSDRGIGGAPVVDDDGSLVGLLEDDDLIVQDARLHFPTVISVLGAYLELPSSLARMEKELHKAVGSTVGEVMDSDPASCGPDDTLESVATVMHERNISRLPVVDGDGRVVGIVSRGDLVRAIIADEDPASGDVTIDEIATGEIPGGLDGEASGGSDGGTP